MGGAGMMTIGEASELYRRFEVRELRSESQAIRMKLEKLNPVTQQEAYDELFVQLICIDGELYRRREMMT